MRIQFNKRHLTELEYLVIISFISKLFPVPVFKCVLSTYPVTKDFWNTKFIICLFV